MKEDYKVVVELKIKLQWLSPHNSEVEKTERENLQNEVNHKAFNLKKEIERKLNNGGINGR